MTDDDPRCSNCDIPLRAVIGHANGRCADDLACNARHQLLQAVGHAYVVSPEGATRFGPDADTE